MIGNNPADASIAIVGAGPRGAGLIERFAANLGGRSPDRRLTVHLIDPHPPGPGRIWRRAQSPLLWMNSTAADVTMYLDETVRCEGPIVPGPSLAEWAAAAGDPEVAEVTGASFVSRRLLSKYLGWVYRRAVADLPDGVEVVVHPIMATAVQDALGGGRLVRLADGATVRADLVVLASGHLDAELTGEERDLTGFAGRHGLVYLPPQPSTDTDLDVLRPGQPVIMRGFGLAFVDLMVLLFEGRGGRYLSDESAPGGLRYQPSGAEPLIYVGSRRGMPYHAKTDYQLRAGRPPVRRFFGGSVVDELVARPGLLDLRADLWPLMAKEIGWAFYHELFVGHPDQVLIDWDEFARRYTAAGTDHAELLALAESAVPDPDDRLDLAHLDRPLAGLRFDNLTALQQHVRTGVRTDLRRHVDPRHTAELAAFVALLVVYGELGRIVAAGKLDPRSRYRDLPWWHGFFSCLASGPPPPRLRQLLALSEAGLVTFLGADMWVRSDPDSGRFVAGSASIPDTVSAAALVESRLPSPTLVRTRDPVLRGLLAAGQACEDVARDVTGTVLGSTGLVRVDARGQLLDDDGVPSPDLFGLGPHTTNRTAGAFTRPRTNAPSFRQNDALARTLLRRLGMLADVAAASRS